MEHRSDADMGPEVLRIGRDREKGVGCCSKQDAIDDRLVLISDIGNLLWQRKYHMEIRHRKQIGFTCGKPFARRCALALRAVSITAGIVSDECMCAVVPLHRDPEEELQCRQRAVDAAWRDAPRG